MLGFGTTFGTWASLVWPRLGHFSFLITCDPVSQVLSDQGKFERADDLYRRAQEVDPSNANLHVHRALIALQWKGDVTGAVDLIKEGLGLDEKCEFAYETLGTIEVTL